MRRTILLALVLVGCDESKPTPADARLAPDTRLALDVKLGDGKRASDGRADQRGRDGVGDRKAGERLTDAARERAAADAPASFACGALLSCKTASEYCEKFTGGACGGPSPSDAGLCPPNCNLTSCPGGQQVCLCQTFSCKPLPTGCASCACVGASGACTCSQPAAGGPIQVHCMAP